jgi:hypothetical protein
MKKLVREPLLYFLLTGGTLFWLFQQTSPFVGDDDQGKAEIIVSEGRLEALKLGFDKVWQRPPTSEEMNNLIEGFVKEEVLYREALAMGLDSDDPIVRRRMGQKMGFITEDLAGLDDPGDAELQQFLDDSPDSYRLPVRLSFRQIYFDPGRSPDVEDKAAKLLKQLTATDQDIEGLGDSLMLPSTFRDVSEFEISRTLGQQFTQSLLETPLNSWQGPVISGFGFHLVYISEMSPASVPDLVEVRDQVYRDWASKKREQTNKLFYETLRARYDIKIESRDDADTSVLSSEIYVETPIN